MSQSEDKPRGDPWNAFGYLVSGVLMWGVIGWLLDRWWDTSFMVAIGILFGAGLGLFMTWARFGSFGPRHSDTSSTGTSNTDTSSTGTDSSTST